MCWLGMKIVTLEYFSERSSGQEIVIFAARFTTYEIHVLLGTMYRW